MIEQLQLREGVEAALMTDGSAIPNPGTKRIGVLILDREGKVLGQAHSKMGRGTNNQAELEAYIAGLDLALEKGLTKISCFSDSQLMVNQISGAFKVSKQELKVLHSEISKRKAKFKYLDLSWRPRESVTGTLADAVSRNILFTEGESIWPQIPPSLKAKMTHLT